ncbi:Hypothetical protein F387_00485 [Wohlfahrtiimonas chitiniclastica SH04]|uniref:Uncharacterized protein n=1 Tax=Wohlfahrtiimonas chitiniclastica SH04 TaxID=1261130 RepID=L8XWF4_9GAMM|nr:Hypothetical protein F387_00485 [Wohlfahrtiimonas chitiniclastica SH04]
MLEKLSKFVMNKKMCFKYLQNNYQNNKWLYHSTGGEFHV